MGRSSPLTSKRDEEEMLLVVSDGSQAISRCLPRHLNRADLRDYNSSISSKHPNFCTMHHLSTIALFASLSNALAVNKEARTTISHGRQTSQDSLDRCEAAANCEVYDDDFWGKAIRFKEGMGPGTKAHKSVKARNVVKRDITEGDLIYKRDGAHSVATISDKSINFGSAGASGTYGLFHKLYDVCHEGGCESNPIYLSSTYASDTSEYQQDLALYARGSYNG